VSPDKGAYLRFHGSRELASGVDALYLSGYGDLTASFVDDLARSRELAEMVHQPLWFNLGAERFQLYPHGWGRYHYLLAGEAGSIGFSTGKHLPPVRVQPRSSRLHFLGPAATVALFHDLLAEHCDGLSFSVNRVDLYVDVQRFSLDALCRERFVCRANHVRLFEEQGALQGIQLGMRSAKTFSARIYDKTADVERSGADWWREIWGEGYDPGLPVWRVGLEIGRKAITEFGLDSPQQVLAAVGDLWHYGTTDWLTYRSPTEQERTRWPLSPEWLAVQQASLCDQTIGLTRMRAGRRAGARSAASFLPSPATWPPSVQRSARPTSKTPSSHSTASSATTRSRGTSASPRGSAGARRSWLVDELTTIGLPRLITRAVQIDLRAVTVGFGEPGFGPL
jgi:hypothetical protein